MHPDTPTGLTVQTAQVAHNQKVNDNKSIKYEWPCDEEPVELLPRDDRLMAMQAELISEEYRLEYEECGEGSAKRIKILHTYIQ